MVGIDRHHLGRAHLPQRRAGHGSAPLGGRPHQGPADLEAPLERRQSPGAEAEHVVAVAGHRRAARVGDDRHRDSQGVRLRRQGNLGARHPEGPRPLRPQLGLRLVAAPARGRAVRAGAARDEDRRSLVLPEDRQGDGQDAVARRAADESDSRVARFVHDAGAPSLRQHHRDRVDRRRRGDRSRSGDRQGIVARRRTEPDEQPGLPDRRVAVRVRRDDLRADAGTAAARAARGRPRRHHDFAPRLRRSTADPTCRRR